MATQFGLLSKLEFLQTWASKFIAKINPAVIHNIEKYYIIKKVFYLSAIEDIEGDYLEFGVYTGSSFCHAIRCNEKLAYLNKSLTDSTFWGFDSFQGFGKLAPEDEHIFYTDHNFETSLTSVNKRVTKIAKSTKFKLIPGFFDEVLKLGTEHYNIKKARIIFIDSDTYTSANDALTFCLPLIQEGTFIILDDYYSYKGSNTRGVAKAFKEFTSKGKLEVRHVFNYGMGGVVYIVSAMNSVN